MSKFKCIFLGADTDESPVLDEYAHFFLDYRQEKWGVPGDGVFIHEDGGYQRAALVVLSDRAGGISVRYDDASARAVYYSIGCIESMSSMIDAGDDQFATAGSFVSPAIAWHAVEDFFINPLEKSARIHWMDADDLPNWHDG